MLQVVGGVAAGAVAMMVAPKLVKPLSKALIKGGMLAFESGKQAVHQSRAAIAGAVESLEDLAAEAKAEVADLPEERMVQKKAKKKAAA
jgi:gas vesicle protein